MKKKYLFLTLPALYLSLITNTLQAESKTKEEITPLQSNLVTITVNKELAEEDKDLQRLFNNDSSPAIRITFLVKAENIIQVMKKTITTTNSEGWTCGSFPRISDDAKAVAFVIKKKGDFLDKVRDTKVEGSIEIQTGTKLIPKTFSLMSFDAPLRIDDFVFTLLENKLKITGNHKLIKKIKVEQDDQILKTYESSWSDDSRTYNYKGISKGAKITFSYWDGIIIRKVNFVKK